MKINSAIIDGVKILNDNLIFNPHLDAEMLMAKVINKDRKYVLLNSEQKLNNEELYNFKKLIKKRSNNEPVAYLTNKKSFWTSDFYITKNTLIPRPETELLVETALKITQQKNNLSVLDIGIGSGCILISILKERKNFYGTGIDVSKNCIKISKINAKKHKIYPRVKFFKTNVDKFLLGKYDLIVSNPPYINKYNLKYLEKDIVDFEPKLALDGGLNGISEIRKVIKKSSELIKKRGKLILEIGFDQKNKVINLLKNEGFYINYTLKDLAGNDRCIVSTKI